MQSEDSLRNIASTNINTVIITYVADKLVACYLILDTSTNVCGYDVEYYKCKQTSRSIVHTELARTLERTFPEWFRTIGPRC